MEKYHDEDFSCLYGLFFVKRSGGYYIYKDGMDCLPYWICLSNDDDITIKNNNIDSYSYDNEICRNLFSRNELIHIMNCFNKYNFASFSMDKDSNVFIKFNTFDEPTLLRLSKQTNAVDTVFGKTKFVLHKGRWYVQKT